MKLTSDKIDWKDGENFALCSGLNDCVIGFSAEKPSAMIFNYVVKREEVAAENVKLRLDYFLSLGLKLVEGDSMGHSLNCNFNVTHHTVKDFNTTDKINEQYFITSFTSRKNTGEKPCGDDVPVVTFWRDMEDVERHLADSASWSDGMIKRWKPGLDALIKMQIEHDKGAVKREEAIDPIVAAIFALGCDGAKWSYKATEQLEHLILKCVLDCEMDDETHIKGSVVCGGNWFDEKYYRLICTIEQFNQCVKELTGCTKEHQAWLTALKDIREYEKQSNRIGSLSQYSDAELLSECVSRIDAKETAEQKEIRAQIKVLSNTLEVQTKSLQQIKQSQSDLIDSNVCIAIQINELEDKL